MGGQYSTQDVPKTEMRMVQAMQERAKARLCKIKSFNTVMMKFPKIDVSFREMRAVFQKFDQDDNGAIDLEELRTCFRELRIEFTDEEVKDFYEESDMDASHDINFKEFILVLALAYLFRPPAHSASTGLEPLGLTFETIAEAFVFFDLDKDGYISKTEMIKAINDGAMGEDNIGKQRFEEMDWNKDGRITFKEFLFAFTDWVDIEAKDEDEEGC